MRRPVFISQGFFLKITALAIMTHGIMTLRRMTQHNCKTKFCN
jgi:hypothetical protein